MGKKKKGKRPVPPEQRQGIPPDLIINHLMEIAKGNGMLSAHIDTAVARSIQDMRTQENALQADRIQELEDELAELKPEPEGEGEDEETGDEDEQPDLEVVKDE